MRCAYARQPARDNLSALRHELPQQPVILIVDVFDFLRAELANLLTPEKFTSAALARRSARTASRSAKSRTISARPRTRFRPRCRLLWCFCFVSHNSPIRAPLSSALPNLSVQIPLRFHFEQSEESASFVPM